MLSFHSEAQGGSTRSSWQLGLEAAVDFPANPSQILTDTCMSRRLYHRQNCSSFTREVPCDRVCRSIEQEFDKHFSFSNFLWLSPMYCLLFHSDTKRALTHNLDVSDYLRKSQFSWTNVWIISLLILGSHVSECISMEQLKKAGRRLAR